MRTKSILRGTIALLAAGFYCVAATDGLIPVSMGMIGITAAETAQVSVLNLGGDRAIGDVEDGLPCPIEFTFLDENGRVLRQMNQTIAVGQAGRLALPGPEITSGVRRTQVRAQARVLGGSSAKGCQLALTLEVFDNTSGRTSLIMAASQTVAQQKGK
jgi:hypothetical protein